jgi:hypothetical protein
MGWEIRGSIKRMTVIARLVFFLFMAYAPRKAEWGILIRPEKKRHSKKTECPVSLLTPRNPQ